MTNHIKRRAFAVLFVAAFLAQSACKSDPINCADEKVGDVFFEAATADFLPSKGQKALVFRDSAGVEMRFLCPTPTIERVSIKVEKLCEALNLAQKFKFVQADLKDLNYATASAIAPVQFEMRTITANAILQTADKTAFFDLFSATFFDGLGGAEISFLLSERDAKAADLDAIRSGQRFRSITDTTILGKNFKDVLAALPFSGSDPKSKSAFYFQKNRGPVAFSLDGGRAFVFDREE